jgi:type II secretory pathway component PulJ
MRQRTRRGATLIEIVTVGAVLAVVLTLTNAVIHTLLSASRTITNESQLRRTVARLQLQWGRDGQEAVEVENPLDGEELLWKGRLLGGEVVEYRLKEKTVERVATGPDGRLMRREGFSLPRGYRFARTIAEFPWTGRNVPPRLALQVEQQIIPLGTATNGQALEQTTAFEPTGLRIAAPPNRRNAEKEEPSS